MTIDDTTPTGNGRDSKDGRRVGVDGGASRTNSKGALVDSLNNGLPYALAFGGQGAPWLSTLEELSRDNGLEPILTDLVNDAAARLAPLAQDLVVVRPIGFDPVAWILEAEIVDEEEGEKPAGPSAAALTAAPVSLPGVFLTQLAALLALTAQGLDIAAHPPVSVIGHSQGVLATAAVAAGGNDDGSIFLQLRCQRTAAR